MDFTLTGKDAELRDEVRTWLARELPEEWEANSWDEEVSTDDKWAITQTFCKKLAAKGWIAPAWPVEYGGMGATHLQQFIFSDELAYRRAPVAANLNRVGFAGPTLILHGTDEQRRRFLPGITAGETMWVQGFSEPNAGSDLASLQTRAVRDGDGYRLNGSKIWTSGAHRADRALVLARTDPDAPKHRGISFFLLDMKTPGITLVPLVNMVGEYSFNQVYFEDVWVPAEDRVGEENRGWYIGTSTLDFERSSVGMSSGVRREFEELVKTLQSGIGRLDQKIRSGLADTAIELAVARNIALRVVHLQSQGKVPNYEASMSKVFASEVGGRFANLAVRALGVNGLVPEGYRTVRDGKFARNYLGSAARGIGGGTSEIQRNIIATRGLGLPRG